MKITTGIILLAAGNSSRLGRPKQLLKFRGKTLLRQKIEAAKLIPFSAVFVVVGANVTDILPEIEEPDVIVCYNTDWASGMGSSIQTGMIEMLERFPAISQCLISVCDQPLVDQSVFNLLIEKQKSSQKEIIATAYQNIVGVPVLFHKSFFSELLHLKQTEGAKKIIQKHMDKLDSIRFEDAAFDIDTIEDLAQLQYL